MKHNKASSLVAISLLLSILAGLSLSGAVLGSGTTAVNLSPSTQNVALNGAFTLDVIIAPQTAIAGAQFDLSFDPALVTVQNVQEGNFLKQNGAGTYFAAGTINNTAGTVTGVAGAITTPGQTVSAEGTFARLNFMAKATAGTASINLSNVVVGDINGDAVAITVSGASVTVGTPATLAVTTNAATALSQHGATLNGDLTNLGGNNSVSVSFEWGQTTSYGETTPIQTMTSSSTFTATPDNFTANTVYHFRARAVGGTSTVYGDDMTLTTLQNNPPVVTTNAATGITFNTATLNGNLTSLGSSGSISVSFEYGPTASYGSTSTIQTVTATGSFAAALSSLTPSTTYHFRAKAIGSTTVYGDDMTFATLPASGNVLLTEALAPIDGKYLIVWGFNAPTQEWTVYSPTDPPYVNTLEYLTIGQGYWLQVSEACTFVHVSHTYTFYQGWNLFGWMG
ncbi:MAG: cohesin domain-containing protein [Dehalococcoidia bacterium]